MGLLSQFARFRECLGEGHSVCGNDSSVTISIGGLTLILSIVLSSLARNKNECGTLNWAEVVQNYDSLDWLHSMPQEMTPPPPPLQPT